MFFLIVNVNTLYVIFKIVFGVFSPFSFITFTIQSKSRSISSFFNFVTEILRFFRFGLTNNDVQFFNTNSNTVKIILFPKPVGRTARTFSPFNSSFTASNCSSFKTIFRSHLSAESIQSFTKLVWLSTMFQEVTKCVVLVVCYQMPQNQLIEIFRPPAQQRMDKSLDPSFRAGGFFPPLPLPLTSFSSLQFLLGSHKEHDSRSFLFPPPKKPMLRRLY